MVQAPTARISLAADFCDRLVASSERSRATQMNAGARQASGDIFWFLHVDAEVPRDCLNEIGGIMQDPTVSGGYFRIRLPAPAVYRLTDSFAHYAGLLLRMRCGDHGIFCRRTAFVDIGGFPNVPMMEDVEFFRRLHQCGRVVHSNKRIVASPRRYEAVGPLRLTIAYGLIATLYFLAVPLPALAPNLPTHLLRCGAKKSPRKGAFLSAFGGLETAAPCARLRFLIRTDSRT